MISCRIEDAMEWLIPLIVDNVFGYLLEQSGAGEKIRSKFLPDPGKAAFGRALQKALLDFAQQYPEWAASCFDRHFLEHDGAPVLAQLLLRDGQPEPTTLARCWASSLNGNGTSLQEARLQKLRPIAAYFLHSLEHELKAEPTLRDFLNDRALELASHELTTLTDDVHAIRDYLQPVKDLAESTRSYLRWVIERNLYLDPRGTYQTQRQVQVKLEDAYISLRAQRDDVSNAVDRYLLGQELAALETQLARSALDLVEAEDRREQVMARFMGGSRAALEKTHVLDLAEVATSFERLVILGDPGSGKTTLLRYLALKHAQALYEHRPEASPELGPARFPLLLRIADYAEYGLPQGKALSEFLTDYCRKYECASRQLTDVLVTQLRQGNCLILLDGLDEVAETDERLKVVQQIEAFVQHYGQDGNRFIVSSRVAGYRTVHLNASFNHYLVCEMDEEQIEAFLQAWCPAVEAAQTPELSAEARAFTAGLEIEGIMHAIKDSPGVRRLAANPLLLRILALIHRTGAQLPQRRIELYRLAADTLARTWRVAQGVPESALVEESYLTRLLGRLAYWLHVNKPTGIATEREVYQELGQAWAAIKGLSWEEDHPDILHEVKKFLRQVREHTGLFVERAPGRYGFMHLTFEEYYAARYLVARSKTRARLIRQHLHDPRWREVILLALGFVSLDSPEDAAELVETAILARGEEAQDLGFQPSKYEKLLGRDYRFALRCLEDQIPVSPRIQRQLLDRLANEMLYQSGSMRYERYKRAINGRLRALKESKAAELLAELLKRNLHDPDRDVSLHAAQSLIRLGRRSSEVLETLRSYLHDENRDRFIQAARGLIEAKQVSEDVLSRLIDISCSAQEAQIYIQWRSAMDAFGLIDLVEHIPAAPLYQLLATERPGRFYIVALQLHKVEEQDRVKLLYELIKAFRSRDKFIQELAVIALRFIRSDYLSSELLQALSRDWEKTGIKVRAKLIGILWSIDYTSRATEFAIIKLLRSKNPYVRRYVLTQACCYLGNLKPEKRPGWVIAKIRYMAFHDQHPGVRRAALRVLCFLSPSGSILDAIVLQVVQNESPLVGVNYSLNVLLKPDCLSEQTIQVLNECLLHKDENVRYKAAYCLKLLGVINDQIISVLYAALQHSTDLEMQIEATKLAGSLSQGEETTLEALLRGLDHEDYRLRNAYAKALAQIGARCPAARDDIEQRLLRLLHDPQFQSYDKGEGRFKYNAVFDSLWQLMDKSAAST
ncbi:NACHT domain-containing protein [Ktedonosporobacter rubrisoli]|uniref:NACHT domain-containing protein n=1 Tax=Ktedonosporobacter rubrisoli TaxID=2509675 RepID=A0A4P6JIM3_KTERU|nr:NACHT domain-containing protein [Ktedonosporobacter rubrisoli]QBD74919.1 NACHT domain-containing protein [Ktedonosporobacter rubrisoli]